MKSALFKIFFLMTASLLFSCGDQKATNETSQPLKTDQTLTIEEDTASLETTGGAKEINEEDLLISAYMNSQLQITLGEVTEEKAASEQVKSFGQTIVEENKEIQEHVNALAEAAGIDVAPALTPEYTATLDSIQDLSGEKFDSAFLEITIREHKDDIERFSKLAASTNDPVSRELVSSTLEVLQRHMEQAEEVQDALEKQDQASN